MDPSDHHGRANVNVILARCKWSCLEDVGPYGTIVVSNCSRLLTLRGIVDSAELLDCLPSAELWEPASGEFCNLDTGELCDLVMFVPKCVFKCFRIGVVVHCLLSDVGLLLQHQFDHSSNLPADSNGGKFDQPLWISRMLWLLCEHTHPQILCFGLRHFLLQKSTANPNSAQQITQRVCPELVGVVKCCQTVDRCPPRGWY